MEKNQGTQTTSRTKSPADGPKQANYSPAIRATKLNYPLLIPSQCGANTTALELPSSALPKSLTYRIVLFHTTKVWGGLLGNNRKSEHIVKF